MTNINLTIQNKETFLNVMLKEKLDFIVEDINKNWDFMFIIDGKERSGKSTLGITCGAYLSELLKTPFTINNIATGGYDALSKLEHLPDKSVLLVDEAGLMFASADAMTKEQKQLRKVLEIIGQKNMAFILVLPVFTSLHHYPAVERSRFLLHTTADTKTLKRGTFSYYGEEAKRMFYKNYKKDKPLPRPEFMGNFDNFDLWGEEYRKTKVKSLFEAFNKDSKTQDVKRMNNIKAFIHVLIEKGLSYRDIQDAISKYGGHITLSRISEIANSHNSAFVSAGQLPYNDHAGHTST